MANLQIQVPALNGIHIRLCICIFDLINDLFIRTYSRNTMDEKAIANSKLPGIFALVQCFGKTDITSFFFI
jgi:hypothetical protein